MNFKKYHVSRNLFDVENVTHETLTADGSIRYESAMNLSGLIRVDGDYTVSWSAVRSGAYMRVSTYDDNKNFIARIAEPNTYTRSSYSNTHTGYIRINYENSYQLSDIMLNTGSTALPYEPYGDTWHNIPHYIHNTSTDTLQTLPADVYANDTTATVGLKGNMSQTGTPTPETPIQPSECGERTGNLISKDMLSNDTTLDSNTGLPQLGYGRVGTKNPIDVSGYTDIALSYNSDGVFFMYSLFSGSTFLGRITGKTSGVSFDVSNADKMYICFYKSENISKSALSNIMLNTGSTALPYEPYGVKIPILSNSTTTNVYLGETQSTRRIKKLVFDGTEEGWEKSATRAGCFALRGIGTGVTEKTMYCTHATYVSTASQLTSNNTCYMGNDFNIWLDLFDAQTTIEQFKEYLTQQYANGTPVCVWYVLATPETAVVNEPIRKIGDYADTVSGITIPVTAGANTLSIGTTLQPSEVTATYKGWHPVADVHVYPDSSWMPTSWEEFRKAVRSGKAQSLYPVGTKLYENWGDTTSDAWIVVDYPTGEDYLDSDLAQQGYTNRVMLMEEKLNYLRQFDAIEAWLYVETAIPAGTYRFTIPNYDASYGGNKTYIFTSTANVPVGGQLTLTWAYQQNPSAVQAYSSATSTSTLFNVSIIEWDGTTACTDLGTIKLAQNDADSTYGKLNHIHRARYGSNNYYQSGYRQWLNTNASANWWTPTNVFDRPYGNRTNAGRLNVMNSNMKSVLATPTVNCITNNLFEYPSLDGTTFSLQTAYTVKDKLFPATHSEVNLSSSPNVNSVLDYYVGKGNADRIKYRKDNGNAYYWWLRTPYPTNAHGVRGVSTSGALYSVGANGTSGSAAACIIQ